MSTVLWGETRKHNMVTIKIINQTRRHVLDVWCWRYCIGHAIVLYRQQTNLNTRSTWHAKMVTYLPVTKEKKTSGLQDTNNTYFSLLLLRPSTKFSDTLQSLRQEVTSKRPANRSAVQKEFSWVTHIRSVSTHSHSWPRRQVNRLRTELLFNIAQIKSLTPTVKQECSLCAGRLMLTLPLYKQSWLCCVNFLHQNSTCKLRTGATNIHVLHLYEKWFCTRVVVYISRMLTIPNIKRHNSYGRK
jgi:hypothetical protein